MRSRRLRAATSHGSFSSSFTPSPKVLESPKLRAQGRGDAKWTGDDRVGDVVDRRAFSTLRAVALRPGHDT